MVLSWVTADCFSCCVNLKYLNMFVGDLHPWVISNKPSSCQSTEATQSSKDNSVALCNDKGYTPGCSQDMGNHAQAATWSGHTGHRRTTKGRITQNPFPFAPFRFKCQFYKRWLILLNYCDF